MNYSKNLNKMRYYLNTTILVKKNLIELAPRNLFTINNYLKYRKYAKTKPLTYKTPYSSYDSVNISETEEVTGVYPFVDSHPLSRSEVARNVLFKNNTDLKIQAIAKCVSVEEVFSFLRENITEMNFKHLTQTVFVLYDLQNIFLYHVQEEDNLEIKEQFFKKILEHKEFYMLTEALKDQLDTFEPMFLSYAILYLNKLGVKVDEELIQRMALKLCNQLLDKFSLNIAARLLRVVFAEHTVRPYYLIMNLIPDIYRKIDTVQTIKDLEDLTICLYKLSFIITKDELLRYETKINQLINDGILTGQHYQTLLKVLSVFNNPRWRFQFSSAISSCILLLKQSIDSLNLMEMYQIYDIFFKNQEPGEALNMIQRGAAKLLNEIDDMEVNRQHKLKLFSSVIYFASPINKAQFRHDVEKYINEKNTLSNIITLRKIFSYLKISHSKLCEDLWNKALKVLKFEKDFDNVKKLMENYLYFCGDMPDFRHLSFEHHALTLVEKKFQNKTLTLFPNHYFSALAFALVVSYNVRVLNLLLQVFKELSTQINPIEVFLLSHALLLVRQRKPPVTQVQVNTINSVLKDATARLYSNPNIDLVACGVLIKAAIIRRDSNNELIDDMIMSLKHPKYMCSKLMEYMCFNLYATKTLIPEVINKCTEYVTHNQEKIVGFNVDKLLWLLYQLNYQPVYEDEFFKIAIDIIIRDQERLSGLSFLQSSLALCFFNRIPKSFMKQIFNVEFLEKLDGELANCYYRDRYPHRVQSILMQLNRAVCLEYPEYNVPWFHQKYIEEYQKTNAIDDVVNYFHRSVKDYLQGLLGKGTFLENVMAPYGYDINFVFHVDQNKRITTDFENPLNTKLAIILQNDTSFTRFYVRLKGKHAFKQRHLEILGYKVKMIKYNEWSNLLYAKEKIDYLNEILFL